MEQHVSANHDRWLIQLNYYFDDSRGSHRRATGRVWLGTLHGTCMGALIPCLAHCIAVMLLFAAQHAGTLP